MIFSQTSNWWMVQEKHWLFIKRITSDKWTSVTGINFSGPRYGAKNNYSRFILEIEL